MKSRDKKRSVLPLESSKKTEVTPSTNLTSNSPQNGSDEFSEDIKNKRVTPNTASQIIMESSVKNAKEILAAGYDDENDAVLIVSELVKFHTALLMLQIQLVDSDSLMHKFLPELAELLIKRFESAGVEVKKDSFVEIMQLNIYDDYLALRQGEDFLAWVEKYHAAFQREVYSKLSPEERVNFKLIYNLCPILGFDAKEFPIVDGLNVYVVTTGAWTEMTEFWRSISNFKLESSIR